MIFDIKINDFTNKKMSIFKESTPNMHAIQNFTKNFQLKQGPLIASYQWKPFEPITVTTSVINYILYVIFFW